MEEEAERVQRELAKRGVPPAKAAEDGCRYDAAHVLDGAMDRSVFVERPMSPQLIIIGSVLRQNPA